MPSAPTHRFTFDGKDRARLFVMRLLLTLVHVAIYRDGLTVFVVDGSETGQCDEIVRLAKMSGSLPEMAPSPTMLWPDR